MGSWSSPGKINLPVPEQRPGHLLVLWTLYTGSGLPFLSPFPLEPPVPKKADLYNLIFQEVNVMSQANEIDWSDRNTQTTRT